MEGIAVADDTTQATSTNKTYHVRSIHRGSMIYQKLRNSGIVLYTSRIVERRLPLVLSKRKEIEGWIYNAWEEIGDLRGSHERELSIRATV